MLKIKFANRYEEVSKQFNIIQNKIDSLWPGLASSIGRVSAYKLSDPSSIQQKMDISFAPWEQICATLIYSKFTLSDGTKINK